MRRTIAVLAFSAVLASATSSFLLLPESVGAAEAADTTFVVPAHDGYGVGECLASGGECGRVIANAWCETQGFARAVAFGPAAPETTAAIQKAATAPADRPVSVTCSK
jgi:hypothetical protein